MWQEVLFRMPRRNERTKKHSPQIVVCSTRLMPDE